MAHLGAILGGLYCVQCTEQQKCPPELNPMGTLGTETTEGLLRFLILRIAFATIGEEVRNGIGE